MVTVLEERGHVRPLPGVWIVHFAWPTNPLPMNGSRGSSWRSAARKGAKIRNQAQQMIHLAGIPPLGRCKAQLTWWVEDATVRDPDNLGLLEKRLFDALVSAGVVTDDRPALMVKPRATIRMVAESNRLVSRRCFTLTITQLEENA